MPATRWYTYSPLRGRERPGGMTPPSNLPASRSQVTSVPRTAIFRPAAETSNRTSSVPEAAFSFGKAAWSSAKSTSIVPFPSCSPV